MKIPLIIPYRCQESSVKLSTLINDRKKLNPKYFSKNRISFYKQNYVVYKAALTSSCIRTMDEAVLSFNLIPQFFE